MVGRAPMDKLESLNSILTSRVEFIQELNGALLRHGDMIVHPYFRICEREKDRKK